MKFPWLFAGCDRNVISNTFNEELILNTNFPSREIFTKTHFAFELLECGVICKKYEIENLAKGNF